MKNVVLVGLVFLVIALFSGCSQESNSATSVKKSVATQPSSVQQEQTETSQETTASAETNYNIGDTAILNDWEVTLESAPFEKSVSTEYLSSSASDGNQFLVLNVSVKNNGTESRYFTAMLGGVNIKAYYNQKYEYKITLTMIDGDMALEQIQPLATAKGFIVIEMPETVIDATESIVVKMKEDNSSISWNIR